MRTPESLKHMTNLELINLVMAQQDSLSLCDGKIESLQHELGAKIEMVSAIERERLKAIQQREDAIRYNGKLIDITRRLVDKI